MSRTSAISFTRLNLSTLWVPHLQLYRSFLALTPPRKKTGSYLGRSEKWTERVTFLRLSQSVHLVTTLCMMAVCQMQLHQDLYSIWPWCLNYQCCKEVLTNNLITEIGFLLICDADSRKGPSNTSISFNTYQRHQYSVFSEFNSKREATCGTAEHDDGNNLIEKNAEKDIDYMYK